MNQYRMFFIQTSTLAPSMHHKHTKHGSVVCKTAYSWPKVPLNWRITPMLKSFWQLSYIACTMEEEYYKIQWPIMYLENANSKKNCRNQEGPSHIKHDSSCRIDNIVCCTLGYRQRQNQSIGDCNSHRKNGKANRQIVITTSKIKRRNHNKAQLHYTVGNTIPENCQRDVAMNLKCL